MNVFDIKECSLEDLKALRETDCDVQKCFIFSGQGINSPVLDDYDFFFSDDENAILDLGISEEENSEQFYYSGELYKSAFEEEEDE